MFPPTPADNFGSNIRTESPFATGLVRAASKVPLAYAGPNASRSAFARALSDDAFSQNRNQFDLDNVEYQQKAVKARAQDVQDRRESQVKSSGMDTQLKVANATLDTQKRVRLAAMANEKQMAMDNLDNFVKRARTDQTFNTLMGFANAAYAPMMDMAYGPSESQRYMALKAKYGGGPLEGITSGDILAAGSGSSEYRGGPMAAPRLGAGRGLMGGLVRE